MSKAQNHFAKMIATFYNFFEWCYQVRIDKNDRATVNQLVAARWNDPDNSFKELLSYVIGLSNVTRVQPKQKHSNLKNQARQIFQGLFSSLEANGRGAVLAQIYQILENSRPGCTGVKMQNFQLPTPAWGISQSQYVQQQPPAQPIPNQVPQQYSPQNYGNMEQDVQSLIRQEQMRSIQMMIDDKIWSSKMDNVQRLLQNWR